MRVLMSVATVALALWIAPAFAAELTPADYQFMKSLKMDEKFINESIERKYWGDLHYIINSNATLKEKQKRIDNLIIISSCKDFQKTMPDLKCD